MSPADNWNRPMRRRANGLAQWLLKGVGEMREKHIEFGDWCMHYRRPLTATENATLPRSGTKFIAEQTT